MAQLGYEEVLIGAGTSISTAIDLRDRVLVGLDLPAAWTAATIAFSACAVEDHARATSPEPFDSVVDDAGAEVTIVVAASKYVVLSAATKAKLSGLAFVKVISGAFGAQVNQVAAARVTLVTALRESNI